MSINLTSTDSAMVPAYTVRVGNDDFVISAGKRLKIETSPQGVEILNTVVPSGKSWSVHVDVTIIETDV